MSNHPKLDVFTTRHAHGQCSICHQQQMGLRAFQVFWIPALFSTTARKMAKAQYNPYDIHQHAYHICDRCLQRERHRKMGYFLVGLGIALLLPAINLLILAGLDVLSDMAAGTIGMVIAAAVGIAVMIYNIPRLENMYDHLGRVQLKHDLADGNFMARLSLAQINAAKTWTQLRRGENPERHRHA